MSLADIWMDETTFARIIQTEEDRRGCQEPVSIVGCYVKPGADVGCNFLSSISRVRIEYVLQGKDDIQTRSFLIKAPLSDPVLNESVLIENEIQIYEEILPKMYELVRLEVAPKRYKSSCPECLILEDLKEAGYEMRESRVKLDFKHSKAALVTLAKFHAASVAVSHEYPDTLERNGVETVYTHDPKYAARSKPRVLMRLYGLAKVLQTIHGCEKFGDILVDAGDAFWDQISEIFRPGNNLNVLNHGDFWTNNMLFKYDSSGFITDVKLVDYQMRRYCSPAIDLLYLFWTSADDGARMRMYELLEMYRHTLNSSLAELACSERLSRNELREEISRCSPVILLICLFLPVVFPDPESPFDVSKVMATEESMTSLDFDVNPILIPFKSNYFRRSLPEIVKELDTMKIFQVLQRNKKNKKKHS